MTTEGQVVTEEAPPATQGDTPPTDPPAPPAPAPKPSEEYKGLQRALGTAQETIKGLEKQLAAPPVVQPPTGATVQSQSDNAYWQVFNAAKAQGMDDTAAQAYGNAGKLQILLQASQQEVADITAQFQQETAAREAQRASDALLSELRDQARDAGVDPNDPLLDYGEGTQDAATRMGRLRRSIPEVRKVRVEAQASAPAEPVEAPDHSAEAIDTTGSTSPPSGDGERKKQTYLDGVEAYRKGMPGAPSPAEQRRLFVEAKAAGAEF